MVAQAKPEHDRFTFGPTPSKARIADTFAYYAKSAARVQNKAELIPLIAAAMRGQTRAHWLGAFENAGTSERTTTGSNLALPPARPPTRSPRDSTLGKSRS